MSSCRSLQEHLQPDVELKMAPTKSALQSLKPTAIASTGPFAHVTHSDGPARIIFTSGMVGQYADGSISDSYAEQIKQCLVNLGHCLEASGATIKDVLKLTLVNLVVHNSREGG